MSDRGDWYCRNCGYITGARVTNSETCDQCHIPVEWHTADQQGELTTLRAKVAELEGGWVAVEDEEPPKGEEVFIRGDGYELRATLEVVDYNEFSQQSCWGWVLSNRALCLDDDISPTHWRYATPPEDSTLPDHLKDPNAVLERGQELLGTKFNPPEDKSDE